MTAKLVLVFLIRLCSFPSSNKLAHFHSSNLRNMIKRILIAAMILYGEKISFVIVC